jgi:hypothetical protein
VSSPDVPTPDRSPGESVWLPAGLVPPADDRAGAPPTRPRSWLLDESAPAAGPARSEDPRRLSRKWIATVVALVLVGGAAATYLLRHDTDHASTAPAAGRALAAVRQLSGIPQAGGTLGREKAAPVLTVFADVSSPRFAGFDAAVLPVLLSRYVRTGQLRIRVQTLSGGTAGGARVARIVQAAGLQTRLWQLVRALGASRGSRGGRIAAAERLVPGLDREKLVADSRSPRVARALGRAARLAARAHVRGTPAFRITAGPRTMRLPATLGPRAFTTALDAALERMGTAAKRKTR